MLVGDELRELGRVEYSADLKSRTSFKIGGKAECLFVPKDESCLKKAVLLMVKEKYSFYILGAGSNLLISSEGIEGVVIKLEFDDISPYEDDKFYIGASVKINRLLSFMLENSLTGLEFLAGIPASLGGVLVNNASSGNRSVFEVADYVRILEPLSGKIVSLSAKDIYRGYRFSDLEGKVVLGAGVILRKATRDDVFSMIKDTISRRIAKQELGRPSAGCVFKNPDNNLLAGELIDKAGLKGIKRGGACVSSKHANFIINESCALSSDVVYLIDFIKDKVYNKFGVWLEEEIQRWEC